MSNLFNSQIATEKFNIADIELNTSLGPHRVLFEVTQTACRLSVSNDYHTCILY